MAINYSAFAPTVDPLKMAMGGIDIANTMQQAQTNKLKMQQYQIALERKEKMQAALAGLRGVRDPNKFQEVLLQYPELDGSLNGIIENLTEQQKAIRGQEAIMFANLLEEGYVDTARQLITERIEAARNSGQEQEAASLEAQLKLLDIDPKAVGVSSDTFAYKALGAEKYADHIQKKKQNKREQELHGPKLDKLKAEQARAESEAESAAIAAKFAESKEAQALSEQGFDVSYLIKDPELKKINTAYATKQAAAKKAITDADLKKVNLDIQKLEDERDAKVREKANAAIEAQTTFQQTLDDIALVKRLGAKDYDVGLGKAGPIGLIYGAMQGTVLDAATGSIQGALPSVNQDVVDLEAAIERLRNKNFLGGYERLKGGGPITDIEGKKAESAAANLDLRQGSKALLRNLDELEKALLSTMSRLPLKYGTDGKEMANKIAGEVTPEVTPRQSGSFSLVRVKPKGQ